MFYETKKLGVYLGVYCEESGHYLQQYVRNHASSLHVRIARRFPQVHLPAGLFHVPRHQGGRLALHEDGVHRQRILLAAPRRTPEAQDSTVHHPGRWEGALCLAHNRALQPDSDVVFEKDARILRYEGEEVTDQELRRRYGDKTAPYAVGERGLYIDAACQRSAGSMANGSDKNHKHNAVYAVALGPRTISLRANKKIRHGEEILCSYGKHYWSGVKGTGSRTR
jgi:hypothetical protein